MDDYLQVVEILEEVEEGWWKGSISGKVGVFPSNFVEIVEEEEETGQPKQQDQTGRISSTSPITEPATYPLPRSEAFIIHGQRYAGTYWSGPK